MTDNDDSDNRKDLTRIEDLSEFLHIENSEIDSQFDLFNNTNIETENSTENSESFSLDALDDGPITSEEDIPPELPQEYSEELNQDDPQEIFTINEQGSVDEELPDELLEQSSDELIFSSEEGLPKEEISEYLPEENIDLTDSVESFTEAPVSYTDDIVQTPTIDFKEVTDFASNFSYGTVEGEGNPPYSLKIKNIQYQNDAEDILILLKEFEIVTEKNIEDYELALKLGNILIPQISEYTAIILAHKLRRFDIDIELGLSDEIHPTKEQDKSNRGLLKKVNLKQNISEKHKMKSGLANHDFIMSISNAIQGKKIERYLGIITSSLFVSKEDIDRLNFVHGELLGKNLELSVAQDYQNFCSDFDEQHLSLVNTLKNKATKNNANALLGIQFNLNLINSNNETLYQLACSANQVILEDE